MEEWFATEKITFEGKKTSDLFKWTVSGDAEMAKKCIAETGAADSIDRGLEWVHKCERWEDENGYTAMSPLYAAVERKNLEIVTLILSHPNGAGNCVCWALCMSSAVLTSHKPYSRP